MTTEERATNFLEQVGVLESEISAASDSFSWLSWIDMGGYDDVRGFYLVEYTITSDGMPDIKNCVNGVMPMSSGFGTCFDFSSQSS